MPMHAPTLHVRLSLGSLQVLDFATKSRDLAASCMTDELVLSLKVTMLMIARFITMVAYDQQFCGAHTKDCGW